MASITSAFQGRIMDCFRSFLLGKHVHMSAQICFIMSTISYSCVARGMQIEICKFCARSAIKRKRAWIYQLIIALINIGGGGYNLCNPVVRDYPPRQIFTSAKLKKMRYAGGRAVDIGIPITCYPCASTSFIIDC